MAKACAILAAVLSAWCAVADGADLYKVVVQCETAAENLRSSGAEAVFALAEGYLVLADGRVVQAIKASGLHFELVAENVDRDHLVMDRVAEPHGREGYPLLYAEGSLKIRQVNMKTLSFPEKTDYFPIRVGRTPIKYYPLRVLSANLSLADINLDSLIGLVRQDSVMAYTSRLEAFFRRLTGTPSCYAARDWIASKFASFGYDSVVIDSFTGSQLYTYLPVPSQNVIAYKIGARYPDRQIIIGAHFDAVPDGPGADDNASGTAGVLEIARVLRNIETEVTFIFVAFDSEESWMYGSYHYVDDAILHGDDITYMMNLDMIGYYPNDTFANLYYGPQMAYAQLWGRLADSLVGITGKLKGSSPSDHLPFQENGFDVTFVQEGFFSAQYHLVNDSTTYLNFDYQTRMIKASLATVRVIDLAPPPVVITSVRDAGDGQAILLNWIPVDVGLIDHYRIYYRTVPGGQEQSFEVPRDSTQYLVSGLTDGQQYAFHMAAVDEHGHSSVCFTESFGTPHIRPAGPQNLQLLPRLHAIQLNWTGNNTELDFACYGIIRDGAMLPDRIADTSFFDDDFLLGSDMHSYLVVAMDQNGNISDTAGVAPVWMRAATLERGHILAINRSNKIKSCIVNEVATGEFLREALAGYNFDYYSDTAYGDIHRTDTLHLADLLNYELVVIGGESARTDDLGNELIFGGVLDTLGCYLAMGGKMVIFSRWGELGSDPSRPFDTVYCEPGTANQGYLEYFNMDYRVQCLSLFTQTLLYSDLIGAHSLNPAYPDLTWDSLATVDHSSPWTEATGIPCPVYAHLVGAPEILYTYVSRNASPFTHGKPVAWRYLGDDYQYVFFAVPLSFMDRSEGIAALQTAVSQLVSSGPAGATEIEPDTVDLPGGPPATINIYLGDFVAGMSAGDVDIAGIRINNSVGPVGTVIIPSRPPFTGEVLQITVPTNSFVATYGGVVDTVTRAYVVSWTFMGETKRNYAENQVVLIGLDFRAGDANGDRLVNIGDAVYVISYIFRGGPPPQPLEAGDANCNHAINVGDAVYLVNYIFRGGPPPCYP